MNLAIYQPRASYYVGGGEVVPLEHARFLSRLGHRVTLVTTKADFIKPSSYFLKFKKENPQVKIDYLNVPKKLGWIYEENPGSRWIRWDYESFHIGRLAFNYFLDHKFDIVAVHNYVDLTAIPFNRKSVLHLHGYPNESNYLHELLANIPSGFIAVSAFIKNKWSRLAPIKNITVATNGIDSDYFKPKLDATLKYDVCYVGRLIKTKGLSFLIEAVKLLDDLPLRVAIAGTGSEDKFLRNQAKKLKLSKKVNFLGYIEDEELSNLYNSSLMGVFPSYDREGILTTMLENAACGRPSITTTACSMSEFLKDGYNGLLVKPQDSKQLAQAIRKIYSNKQLAEKLGNQARNSIEKGWSWTAKIKQVEKEYVSILSRH